MPGPQIVELYFHFENMQCFTVHGSIEIPPSPIRINEDSRAQFLKRKQPVKSLMAGTNEHRVRYFHFYVATLFVCGIWEKLILK